MQRLPSLTAVRAFECVARHNSFAKAAEELCVTAPSLSHHVKALEDDLGFKLFTRSHRSIALTDKGTVLFDAASRALSELADTWHDLKTAPKAFKVSCGTHFMINWLAPRSAGVQAALNGVELDLITTFEKLNFTSGEVDLAIRNGNEEVTRHHSETIYHEWWTPMAAPELAQRLKTVKDVLACPVVEARHPREPKGHPTLSDWLTAARIKEAHPEIKVIPNTETAMQMAAAGDCIKLCQSTMAGDLHRQGKLVAPFRLALRRQGIRFYIVCRHGDEQTPPVTTIRDFLSCEFKALDDALGYSEMTVVTLPELDPRRG